MRQACKAVDKISPRLMYKWLAQDEDDDSGGDLVQQYARAREVQADAIFDEILEIADDASEDVIIDNDDNERVNHEVVARSRVRIDARKWMAGKLRPKKYGDKVSVDVDAKVKADVNATISPSDALRDYVSTIAKRRGDAGDASA